jgi:hypothetical protein
MLPDAFFTFSYSESSFQEMLPDAYLDFETETKNTVFIFIFIFEKQKQKQPLKNVTGRALSNPTSNPSLSSKCRKIHAKRPPTQRQNPRI